MFGKLGKPLGLGLILVLVVGAVCLFSVFGGGLGNLFGGGNIPSTGSDNPLPREDQGQLGQMYTAVNVDANGCPVETTSQFYRDETIFVGVDESEIPQGTSMFVRLLHEGQPVEDAPEIQADRDMRSCVWFEFQPDTAGGFDPGSYEGELYVNRQLVDSIRFEVSDSASGSSGALPGSSSSNIQLGTLYTSTAVDSEGCPADDTYEFYSDEPVYVSMTESFIPAGTEVFARLAYEGQPVEDTSPVYADQDMQTCVWFVFEGDQGALQPGDYNAEIYVNGSFADSIDFVVQ